MWKFGALIAVLSAIYYVAFYKPEDLPASYGGKFLPQFREVAELFRQQVISGKEQGGNFAVYYKGVLVVDLWGGYADKESRQKWRNDTLPITYSTTKGVASILAAKMVDQKFLDYKSLISKYWPEFGCNGKENITVEMFLHHAAGLSYLDKPISLIDLHHHPENVVPELEKEKPKWPPGTGSAYHGFTFGMFLDQLLKKVDSQNRRIDKLFHDEIGKPFGIDFYIGMPRNLAYRAARFTPFDMGKFILASLKDPTYWSFVWTAFTNPIFTKSAECLKEQVTNDPYTRELALSSISGHGTARALAKLYGILANGGQDGNLVLLSKQTLDTFTAPVNIGVRLDSYRNSTMGRGVFYYKNPNGEPVYGHSGNGGQMAYADPTNKMGVAYLTNDLSIYGIGDDPKFKALEKVLYSCIAKMKKSKLTSNFETFSQ